MNVHRLAASAIVRAPAKLNLFCEVLAKRSDGYHEVETLMVPISLYDTLIARDEPDGKVHVECRWAAPDPGGTLGRLPPNEQNLAAKAVELLRERAGVAAGLRIELVKRIPSESGLGGASSDAAAALLAADAVWNLGSSRQFLSELAAELGSDVPFFLASGDGRAASAAICRGRGERIEPVVNLGAIHFVVVRPPEGLSTAAVYGRCQPAREPRSAAPLVAALAAGDTVRLRPLLHNQLQAAAESLSPWIERLAGEFARQDCLAAQMSGSGTSYFGICRHARHARRVAQRLRSRGVGRVYAASTSQ